MVRALKLPFAVIINRCDMGDDGVEQYCRREGIDIVMRIPNDRKIAEAYSRGTMLVDVKAEYTAEFRRLYERISERIAVR